MPGALPLGLPVPEGVPRLQLTNAERAAGRRRLIEAVGSTGSSMTDDSILVALPASRREYKRYYDPFVGEWHQ